MEQRMSNRDVCKCGGSRKGFCICSAANDNTDEGVIRLPAMSAIATIPAYHRLAISYANLVPLSRRLVVDWLCATIWEYKGIIIDANGRRIDPLDIEPDDVLRTEFDGSLRWVSDFLKCAVEPPRQAPQAKVIPRLELLYLGIAIRFPNVAKRIISD
jgi:hypothetical protein